MPYKADKCYRKFQHKWETEQKFEHAIMKRCIYCNGLKWQATKGTRNSVRNSTAERLQGPQRTL